MPALIDLLNQYLFSDAPGSQARAALTRAWELSTSNSWNELFLDSLDDALTEELPHLSAYSGRNTQRPTRSELERVLATDLGDAGTTLQQLDQNSRAFLTELARAMQGLRLITINRHNLFTDEYRQVLLNLFDHAHTRFKSTIMRAEPEFSAALAAATGYDAILAESVSNYLTRQFGVQLNTLSESMGGVSSTAAASFADERTEIFDPRPNAPDVQQMPEAEVAGSASDELEITEVFEGWKPTPETPAPEAALEPPPAAPFQAVSYVAPELAAEPVTELTSESERAAELTIETETVAPSGDEIEHITADLQDQIVSTRPPEWFTPVAASAAVSAAEELAPPPASSPELTADQASIQEFSTPAFEQPVQVEPPYVVPAFEQPIQPEAQFVPPTFETPIEPKPPLVAPAFEQPIAPEAQFVAPTFIAPTFERSIEPEPPLATDEPIQAARPQPPKYVPPVAALPVAEIAAAPFQVPPMRATPNRLRVLLATPSDVQTERRLLVDLVRELDARSRARFGLELVLVSPAPTNQTSSVAASGVEGAQEFISLAPGQSPVEFADIFIGAVWLQFGASTEATDAASNPIYAGSQQDFALALEQGSTRDEGWLRTVIYRSIRPPQDLLHLDVAEYTRVQQFFERAGAFAGDDLVRVYADPAELVNDARARLDAWIYNYAGDLATALSEYGKSHAATGQAAAALNDFDQAIALYRELDRPERELALWMESGSVQWSVGNAAAASEAFETALRLARRGEDEQTAAEALHWLGAIAANAYEWDRALEYYQEARGYLQPSDAAYQSLLGNELIAYEALGDAAVARSEFEHAAAPYHSALTLAQESGDKPRIATLWNKLGALASEQQDWDTALSAYDNALANTHALDTEARRVLMDAQANVNTRIARRAETAGDTDTAERAYQAALHANSQGSNVRARHIELYAALSALAVARGDWDRTIQSNDRALALLDSPEDANARRALLARQAAAYQQLGQERTDRGDWNAASSAYRDALSLFQELDDQPAQGNVEYHLGTIAAEQGRWQEANSYYAQALGHLNPDGDVALRTQTVRGQADALQHIGDSHRDTQEWGQAEIAYVQARGNLEQLGLGDETPALLYRLGIVTAAQSRLAEGLAYLQQAHARAATPEQRDLQVQIMRAEAETSRRLADMYRGAGDSTSAQANYRQQLDLAQQIEDEALEADAFHSLGLVAADQSDWDSAVDLYDQALVHLNDPAQATLRTFALRHQLSAYEKIGERERAANQLPQAEFAYRSALTVAQTLDDKEREADLLYTLGLVSIDHGNWSEALVDLRRSLGIYNLLPSAPNKPRVIFAIGRAQRGQKQAHLAETMARGDANRDAAEYLAALELAGELGDTRTAGTAAEQLGTLATERSDWDSALQYYDQSLAGFAAPEDADHRREIQRAQLHARRERSEQYRLENQWANADADLFVALDLARELQDSETQGDLVARRGRVAADQGRWNEAIDLYSDALNRFPETHPQHRVIERAQADAYQGLGNTERDDQNWEGASAAYTQALTLQRGIGDTAAQAALLASLGEIATRQARWDDAVNFLTQAHDLAGDSADPAFISRLDEDIALAARALKREQQAEAERRGDALRAGREFDAAHRDYVAALALADELEDRGAQAELNAKLGFVATEQNDHESALARYRAAAGLYETSAEAIQRSALIELQAQTLQELGNRAGENGEWDTALSYYSQSVALLDAPAQSEQRNATVQLEAVTLQNMGDQARANQDLDTALDAFRRAAGFYALVGANDNQRIAWIREGDVLRQLGRRAHAAKDFTTAQNQFALAADRLSDAGQFDALRDVRASQLSVYRDIADAAAVENDLTASRRNYRQALTIADELEDKPAQAELYHRLGQLAARQDDWQGALLSYQYALDRAAPSSELERSILRDQLQAYAQVGTERRVAGDLVAAESNYNLALTNARSLDDSARAGEFAFLLGMLAADQQQWESAVGHYQTALTALPEGDAHRTDVKSYLSAAYQHLGDTQRESGQFDAAANTYAAGLDLADESTDDARAGQILYRVALLQAAQGRWKPALDTFGRAETRLTDTEDETREFIKRDSAFATRTIQRQEFADQIEHANAARVAKEWDDAATAYRAALALAEHLEEPESVASVRHSLVELYAEKGAALQGQEWWDEAADAYTESLALAEQFGDQLAQAKALNALGTLAAEQKRWADTKQYLEQARTLYVSAGAAGTLAILDAQLNTANVSLQQQGRQSETFASAQAAQQQKRFDDAIVGYRESLDLARALDDAPAIAALGTAIVAAAVAKTRARRDQGEWELAEQAARAQSEIAQEFGAPLAQGDALYELGTLQERQGRYPDARAILDAQLNTANVSLQQQARQSETFASAQAAQQEKRFDDAIVGYRESLDLARALDDAPAIGSLGAAIVAAAVAKTRARRDQGEWEQAEQAARAQSEIAQEFGAPLAQGDALYELGALQERQGRYPDARASFAQAEAVYTSAAVNRPVVRAQAAQQRVERVLDLQARLQQAMTGGQTARDAGQPEQAAVEYQTAYDLAGELHDVSTQARMRLALGGVAADRADWQGALAEYGAAGELFDSLEQPQVVAGITAESARLTRLLKLAQRDTARMAGDQYYQAAQWNDAAAEYQQGLDLAVELDDPYSQGEFKFSLAQVAASDHRLESAANLYRDAAVSFADAQDLAQTRSALEHQMLILTALGDEQLALEHWAEARTTYSAAAALSDQLGRREDSIHLAYQLGLVATQQEDSRGALDYFDRALATMGADDPTGERAAILAQQAAVWESVGDAEMDASNLSEAENAYDHALVALDKVGDDAQRAQVLHSLGLVRAARGNWEGARDAHQQASDLLQDLDVPDAQIGILAALAAAEQQLGSVEAARSHYTGARDLATSLDETANTAELDLALGDLAASQAHWRDALVQYDAARASYAALGSSESVNYINTRQADAHNALASLLYGEGQWQETQAQLERALELDAATGRTDREGETLYRLGSTAAAQEDYAAAIDYYDRALAALSTDDTVLRDRTLAQVAFSLQQQGKRAQETGADELAEASYLRALKMAEASDNFDQVADLWFRLGNLYTTQERGDESVRAYRRAYNYDRRDGNALRENEIADALALALLGQGSAALVRQEHAQADENLREALTFVGQTENPALSGEIQRALGDTAYARGDVAAAIDAYGGAGRTFAGIEDTDRWREVSLKQADLLRQVAAADADAGDLLDAENAYRRALLLQQAAGDPTHDAAAHFGLARSLVAQERYDEALGELEQADLLFASDAPERPALRDTYATALEARGTEAFDAARWQDAEFAFTRAAEHRDALGETGRAGLDWHHLAEIAVATNSWQQAAHANEQALARLDTPETVETRREVLRRQGEILTGIGDEQQRAGDRAEASETYRRALAIAQEQGDLKTLARLYALIASLAAEQEQWDDAEAEYQHALEVYQEMEQPVALADTWAQLGTARRLATRYDEAFAAFEQARQLYHQSGERLREGGMLEQRGQVQGDREMWDSALDEYQSALHLYNSIDARRAKASVYRAMERALNSAKAKQADDAAALGDASLDAGDWEEAELSFREALALYTETNQPARQAHMRNQIGIALEAQLRPEEALEQYGLALAGFEQLHLSAAQVGVLANIGDAKRTSKEWNQAEAAYRQALSLNRAENDAARAGDLYVSLGQVREAQHDWEGAIDHYQEALVLFEGAGLADASTQTQASLSRAQLGARVQAKAEYQRALELARESDNYAEAGELLNTLGLMAAEDQKWDEALDYYREAVTAFERVEAESEHDPIWRTAQGTVLNNIGEASSSLGAWNDADYAYSRALGLAREVGDRESEAILLANLGVSAQAQSQLPRALDLNMQALETWRDLGDATPHTELLERVADLQLELNQTAAAETTYHEALKAAAAENDLACEARVLRQLGLLAEGRGADAEALALYEQALTRSSELAQANEQKLVRLRQREVYARTAQWEQAETAGLAALALAEQEGDEPLQAELHAQLSEIAAARGDWQTALTQAQAALPLYEKFDAPREQVILQQRIGHAYAELGELDNADAAYAAALEGSANADTDADLAALWSERAALAVKQNRWADAATHYHAAHLALGSNAAPAARIELLFRRGDAAMHTHAWDTADTSYNDALELANVSGERVQYGWGTCRLGLLAQARRDWDDALANFQEAIEILRQNEEPLGEAQVLNHIARLKLETGALSEADLFAQAALAIGQALGTGAESSRSLYTRGLVALEQQELDPARRFMIQAIAADPDNWMAQLQLGNALLASGTITEAIQQAEAGLGQSPAWALGAQMQITLAGLFQEDQRNFKTNLKRTHALAKAAAADHGTSQEFLDAINLLLSAVEGNAENALAELNALSQAPALVDALDARRFARTALLALSKSPRRFKGKPALVTYFTPQAERPIKSARRRSGGKRQATNQARLQSDEAPSDSAPGEPSTEPPFASASPETPATQSSNPALTDSFDDVQDDNPELKE